jgi:hypothetical protein
LTPNIAHIENSETDIISSMRSLATSCFNKLINH